MNVIDTNIGIGGMAANFGARAKSESPSEKLPVKDTIAQSVSDNTRPGPAQTTASFSTYGSHNERICIVVKNKETGEVIREIPSKEMQKLHAHLDMLA
jgi:uncharacterized FlaG/YvyC family protein